jgi:hypothetical protein
MQVFFGKAIEWVETGEFENSDSDSRVRAEARRLGLAWLGISGTRVRTRE